MPSRAVLTRAALVVAAVVAGGPTSLWHPKVRSDQTLTAQRTWGRRGAVLDRNGKPLLAIVGGRPEQFAGFIRQEIAKWGKVIKDAGIKPQ
mgnify:CR=1 FL=1